MTKVLLTGGSGFIAAHILERLLKRGHHVVTTVRSEDKAQKIREAYPEAGDNLQFVIVPDIAKADAFDEAVKVPGLEVVFHTASPFTFNIKDPKTDLVDPAVIGTTAILKAIARSAPTVRRVVVTSSFAALLRESGFFDPNVTFSEDTWNPVTLADIHNSPATAYRASKTLAERAARDFVADPANGAKFDIVTVNPPMVYGPVVHHLASLSSINTSNERIVACVTGKWKQGIPDSGTGLNWVDVRDVAEAHIRAGLEIPEASGKRLFTTAGFFSNREICDIIRKNFPEYADRLPPVDLPGGEFPPEDKHYKFDNSATQKLLGVTWITLEQSIVDTVNSLKEIGGV